MAAPHNCLQMANIIWAFGRLGIRPGRKWLQDMLLGVYRQSGSYGAAELAQVSVVLVLYAVGEVLVFLGTCYRNSTHWVLRCSHGICCSARVEYGSSVGELLAV